MQKKNKFTRTLELYEPHKMQLMLHESKARFRVASFGRQAGKSTFGVNELLKKAWESPHTKYWFVSPIYSQAEVQFNRLVDAIVDSDITKNINISKLSIKLINESIIEFKSGETLQRLRGDTLDGVVIDEVRDQHPLLWPQVLRAMLSTTKGWAVFISTPNGFDQFYDFYCMAEKDKTGAWEAFKATSICNPLFDEEEYNNARSELTEPVFDQEINANFRDLTAGRAYYSYGEHNETEINPFCNKQGAAEFLPIILGCDFNLNPMSWHLGQMINDRMHWFDEIHLERSNTPEAALELVSRVKNHKPGLIICGDATGKAKQRTSNQSDYDVLKQILDLHQIKWTDRTPESNPGVRDRVTLVNARLKAADGKVHVTIDPTKCSKLKKDFERVVWKDAASSILDSGKLNELTHASDGPGYAICEFLPSKPVSAGILRVIRR